ncbi:hypothetical protein Xsto_01013 [Xenorhabdus stockiae]|uniref:Uncharacterized protein n=1 Tax=Xenorhabdus stockiae TaxID=351614 RepID=A0A2D0KTC9_9GAMM|nr:hypothetical protein [Xenorhabdus stockiae]PHM66684.1 hypothetical protein Xsto_01013 [Xenorhabdus stockiae]
MSEAIVTDGDILQFSPQFGERTVIIPSPNQIKGTGHAQINGKKVCILKDAESVSITANYFTPIYKMPGKGTITITLNENQKAYYCTSDGPLIIKGLQFIATFQPSEPAKEVSTLTPDPNFLTPSSGTGSFNTQQTFSTVN